MILPEPCEARRVLETRALQAASSGLESNVGYLSDCHQNYYAGFPGLAGLPPAPHQKKTPSLGGEDVCDTAKTHPRNPPKPPLWSTGLIISDTSMAFTYTDAESRHRACSAIASENRLCRWLETCSLVEYSVPRRVPDIVPVPSDSLMDQRRAQGSATPSAPESGGSQ